MTKALMTIHGFLTDINDFGRLYDYLTDYDTVVACKIPGHNDEVDFRQFTVENTLKAVMNCYDQLAKKYDEIDVVGYSMGGALATYLATQRKINKIVLVAPANKYINLATPFSTLKFYLRFVHKSFTETTGSFKEKFATAKKALAPYMESVKISNGLALKRLFPYINLHTFNVFTNLVKVANKEVEQYSPIETPTLALWGEMDELVPKTSVEYVSKHFKNLQKVVYPDATHAMLRTNKDAEVIAEILKFLSDGQSNVIIPTKTTT